MIGYWYDCFVRDLIPKCVIFVGALLLITFFAYRKQSTAGKKISGYAGFLPVYLKKTRWWFYGGILWLFGATIMSSWLPGFVHMVFSLHFEILGGMVIIALLPKGVNAVAALLGICYICYIVSETGIKPNAIFFSIGFLYLLIGFGFGLWLRKVLNPAHWEFKKYKARGDVARQQWLESLGSSYAERVKSINEIFDRKDKNLTCCIDFEKDAHQSKSGLGQEEVYQYYSLAFSRNLASMETREREALRAVELLHSVTDRTENDERWYDLAKSALIWGDGKATFIDVTHKLIPDKNNENRFNDTSSIVNWYMEENDLSVEKIINNVFHRLEKIKNEKSQHPEYGPLVKAISARLMGGNTWLASEDVSKTPFASQNSFALKIGVLEDSGQELTYSGEGSLISIAPPGAGKTQCNVFPNLLTWRGPAVVLDVKGEIYAKTSKWRAENVGPVFKFSPLDPVKSHCYNPLSFVRLEMDYIWEDSRFVADMMIVPAGGTDPFWENKARDVLTAAIAFICYSNPPDQRPMYRIMDIIHGGKPWQEMILGLQTAVDVRSMVQQGTSLAAMSEKTRDGVLQSAQSSLSAWTGERISRVTQKSDWSPLDLRSGKNPTIYICLKPSEVDSYVSLLRVFIAQHIRMLTNELPPHGCAPILFLLDELPRLKRMPPVEEAIEIGRQYGLRLWMFAQSLGQLEQAYPNAEGMVGSCAVRIFMNPSSHDGTAGKLSEELGFRESALDGSRQKVVEAADLAGPDYKDYQIVMAASCKPVKVKKSFAWQDPELAKRMGSL